MTSHLSLITQLAASERWGTSDRKLNRRAAVGHCRPQIDGELCGVMPDGRKAFKLIQNAIDTGEGSLVFFLFDLLLLDGENLTALPLSTARQSWHLC
jgi:hypothetical protein